MDIAKDGGVSYGNRALLGSVANRPSCTSRHGGVEAQRPERREA
jgi:hypothetical protein